MKRLYRDGKEMIQSIFGYVHNVKIHISTLAESHGLVLRVLLLRSFKLSFSDGAAPPADALGDGRAARRRGGARTGQAPRFAPSRRPPRFTPSRWRPRFPPSRRRPRFPPSRRRPRSRQPSWFDREEGGAAHGSPRLAARDPPHPVAHASPPARCRPPNPPQPPNPAPSAADGASAPPSLPPLNARRHTPSSVRRISCVQTGRHRLAPSKASAPPPNSRPQRSPPPPYRPVLAFPPPRPKPAA